MRYQVKQMDTSAFQNSCQINKRLNPCVHYSAIRMEDGIFPRLCRDLPKDLVFIIKEYFGIDIDQCPIAKKARDAILVRRESLSSSYFT